MESWRLSCSIHRWPVGVVCDFYNNFGGMDDDEEQITTIQNMWGLIYSVRVKISIKERYFRNHGRLNYKRKSKQTKQTNTEMRSRRRWHGCSLYRCLFSFFFFLFFLPLALVRLGEGAVRPPPGAESLRASDGLNQTIKRYFRFDYSHEKYPLIVRLCPSRKTPVSCPTSASSSSSSSSSSSFFFFAAEALRGTLRSDSHTHTHT